MTTESQIQALQNAANICKLTVKQDYKEDKRKTIPNFFFVNALGNSVSPTMDYNTANHFILGWNNCVRFQTNNK